MLKEDKKLKLFLVLQSFCPLFLLIFIRHFDFGHIDLVIRFFRGLLDCDLAVFEKAIQSNGLGDILLSILCVVWFLITIVVAIGFNNSQYSSFDSPGEEINIGKEKKDSGVTFLVTFVIPLLTDEVSTLRGFMFFVALLSMVILLVMRSDLFYQNPVLAVLRYKIYEFKFNGTPSSDVKANKTYIGITRGKLPIDGTAIKRRYIADDVFMIYNDK